MRSPALNKSADFDFLSDLILRDIVQAKFFQNFKSAFAGLGHMALLWLVDPLALLAAEADLQRVVTVFSAFFLLHNNAGAGLDHRNGDHVTFGVIELRHANFFTNKPSHKSIPSKWSIDAYLRRAIGV